MWGSDLDPLATATLDELASEIQKRTRSGVILIVGVPEAGDRGWRSKKWGYVPETIGMAESFAFDEKMLAFKDRSGDNETL